MSPSRPHLPRASAPSSHPHDGTDAPFSITPVAPGLDCIVLAAPAGTPPPFDQPVNVYLLRHAQHVALINAGHLATTDALRAALDTLGVAPARVERIVVTGLWPDLYGGIGAFPAADIGILAPLQRIEPHLVAAIADLRRRFLETAGTLSALHPPSAGQPTHLVEAFVERFLVPVPRNLRLLPLRSGHTINLAGHFLHVRYAPGTIPGNICLFEPSSGWLFSGDTVQHGHEACWIHDTRALTGTLEELFELEARLLLPNRGPVATRAAATLKHTSLFVNNFLSNATFATAGAMNAPELVARDLGIGDQLTVNFVAHTLGYRALIDELVREQLVDSDDAPPHPLLARFGLARD